MRIGDIACARAGDKADVLDLTLVTYNDRDDESLARVVTAAFAASAMNRVVPAPAVRYELPALRALKYVAPNALQGGVHASLRAGLLWQKAAIYLLLDPELGEL